MSEDRPGGNSAPNSFRLRLTRVDPGDELTVRTLSAELKGFFTHYVRKKGRVCKGKECRPDYHKEPRNWLGYIAAEVWCEDLQLYKPTCLEITQYCELDMRGLYKRGQLWTFRRLISKDKPNTALEARLIGEVDKATLPQAFPLRNVLTIVYFDEIPEAWVENPMPPRPLAQFSQGAPPPNSKAANEEAYLQTRPDRDEVQKLVELMKQRTAAAHQELLEVPQVDRRSAKQILGAKVSTNGTH